MFMYDYIITKPELCEETLAHYGIKGMQWRNKKRRTKESLRSGRPKSRRRNITGSGSGAFKKKINKSASQIYADRLNSARTAEERAAMLAATYNSVTKQNAVVKKGNDLRSTDTKEKVNDSDIEEGRRNIKLAVDQIEKERKKNKK